MTRRRSVPVLATTLALMAPLVAAPAPAGAGRVTTVGVGAREFRFALYRPSVARGTVRLVVHDFGEDAHDVQVLGPHGFRGAVSSEVVPGQTMRLSVRLARPGVYRLVCTKPGHLAAGMRAALRVR